jgi:hypothetical protein
MVSNLHIPVTHKFTFTITLSDSFRGRRFRCISRTN